MQFISHHRLRLLGVLCLALTILPAASDDAARVNKLGHQMMCMCGCNYILMECNHVNCPYSGPMTKELKAAVADGKSDKDILAFFVDKYGPTVLAAPTKHGFDLVAWLMPYFALGIGLVGVVLVARNWRGRTPPGPGPGRATPSNPGLDRFKEQARKDTEL